MRQYSLLLEQNILILRRRRKGPLQKRMLPMLLTKWTLLLFALFSNKRAFTLKICPGYSYDQKRSALNPVKLSKTGQVRFLKHQESESQDQPLPTKYSSAAKRNVLGAFFGRNKDDDELAKILACPVSLSTVRKVRRSYGQLSTSLQFYEASENGLKYPVNSVFIDLVSKEKSIFDVTFNDIVQTGTFRSPLTAFLYERGWRESFAAGGFPGIDSEFEEVSAFFRDLEGRRPTVLDLSCGSGLMTRRLARCGRYGRVLAGDFSEPMLYETRRRFEDEGISPPTLIRLDAARLPFRTGALDAVHCGAALHCYPQLNASLAEIHRVLSDDGGRFFASTFLNSYVPGGSARRRRRRRQRGYKFFELEELRALMEEAGFAPDQVEVTQYGRACAVVKCVKGASISSSVRTQLDDVTKTQGSKQAVIEPFNATMMMSQANDKTESEMKEEEDNS